MPNGIGCRVVVCLSFYRELGSGWAQQVYPYAKSKGVFLCPDDEAYNTTNGDGVSYAYNQNMVNANTAPYQTAYTLAALNAPASTVLLFEAHTDTGHDFLTDTTSNGPINYDATRGTYAHQGLTNMATGPQGNPSENGDLDTNFPLGRHTNGSDYLLADGHVKYLQGAKVSPGYSNNDAACAQGLYDNGGTCNAANAADAAGTANSTFAATFSIL